MAEDCPCSGGKHHTGSVYRSDRPIRILCCEDCPGEIEPFSFLLEWVCQTGEQQLFNIRDGDLCIRGELMATVVSISRIDILLAGILKS